MRGLLLALAFLAASTCLAVEPDEQLDDPVLEERAREISAGLRCLVCQNQSIDDSNAELARDLRLVVRERLQAGDSNGEVRDYVVARYGEYVLLKPPFNPSTFLLWLTPVLVLAAGGIAAFLRFRSGTRRDAPPLSAEEENALRRLAEEPANEAAGENPGAETLPGINSADTAR